MKKGDLVKFVDSIGGAQKVRGVVTSEIDRQPQTYWSGPRSAHVYVEWCSKEIPPGYYNVSMLEVVNES